MRVAHIVCDRCRALHAGPRSGVQAAAVWRTQQRPHPGRTPHKVRGAAATAWSIRLVSIHSKISRARVFESDDAAEDVCAVR